LYVGLLMFFTGRALARAPLVALYHPYLKESIVHHA